MIKVTPYLSTMGSERFKKFLAQPFTFDHLCKLHGDTEVLFDGWRAKDMGSWVKYTNDDEYILEVFPTHYNLKKSGKELTYKLTTPSSINNFIEIMNRFDVQLYWTRWIDENFEPKEYLHVDDIKQYFIDLLAKLDKSNELQ
jgi:hypothetical protein